MQEILGPRGVLARHLPCYEHRPGQLAMARAVGQTLARGGQLVVEAGTGTGKTLAYLIPAIHSARKVVVSTGTKNLQEQLYHKDIPFLARHLEKKFKVCYMKGRSNYLCRRRWAGFSQQPLFIDSEESHFFELVQDWVPRTKTGDRSEVQQLADDSPFWQDICSKSELCGNQKCSFFDNCFITRMKKQALQADLIIVNHHLFFADLALRSGSYGEVIPFYDAVIFDEAHQIEEIATCYFGIEVSNYQLEELLRDSEREILRNRREKAELGPILDKLGQRGRQFFESFCDWGNKFRLSKARLGPRLEQGQRLIELLQLLAAGLQGWRNPGEELLACAQRGAELARKLAFILEPPLPAHVCWGENRGRGCFLRASPLDIAPQLQEKLHRQTEALVFTSATLSIGKDFSFFKQRLGLEGARELLIPEHFDYRRQVAAYFPNHLPEPGRPGFAAAAAEEIKQILRKSQGRALVLFTSYQLLNQIRRQLQAELPYPLLCQGEQPKQLLLKRFREQLQSVLLATSSFWQGVDIPGEALSCLIITKLPFAAPSEPLLEARLEHIRANGGNPFRDYQLPHAAITLRQGFGRLIRNQQDKGVLVILDKRILSKRYGRIFLQSLPECRRLQSQEKIRGFLAGKAGASGPETEQKLFTSSRRKTIRQEPPPVERESVHL